MPTRRRARSSSAPPRALRQGLRRALKLVNQQIDTATGPDGASPELLHDLHRSLRRLEGGLTLWAELLRAPQAGDLQPLLRRLRRLARAVGQLRDRDVTAELLRPSGHRASARRESVDFRRYVARLAEDRATGREFLRATLRAERRAGLFDEAAAALERPPRRQAVRELHGLVHAQWTSHRRKTEKAHRRARKRPTGERLHRLRIRLRRWRHLASLADIAGIPAPEELAPSLARLQARLGEIHDLEVVFALLPPELHGTVPARELKRRLERDRAAVQSVLERDPQPHRRRPLRATRRSTRE